ncbi:MAG: N-acetyltransferase [Rhodospirillales bacterium]|nr:N-acetyltransferase [Rhodospirillales bacterium]
MVLIEPEPPTAAPLVEDLLDRAFGPTRRAKTAERLREGRLPADGLSFIAVDEVCLLGTIRFWHVGIGQHKAALLLGPVAVAASHRSTGLGDSLIRRGLSVARTLGHTAVILVGDAPYYGRFGFSADRTSSMTLPGPVERRRFLACELVSGALADASGLVLPTGAVDPRYRLRAA